MAPMIPKTDRAPAFRSRFAGRGGWWVVGQFALLAAIAAAPEGAKSAAAAALFRRLGEALLAASAGVLAAGSFRLGKRLTPFPRPLEGASLETGGIYRLIRHPLYFGVILAGLGTAALKASPWAFLPSAALAALLNAKADREEAWLSEKFPEYERYKRASRKLIPFLF